MLNLESIDAYYGNSHILQGLSLTVNEDEIVALVGRNGAGKTTTLRSVLGFVPRVEGRITFDGTDILAAPPERVFNLGISWIPERRRIFSNLTVAENLELGKKRGDSSSGGQRRVYGLFPRLEERRRQQAGTMSGGEQQMLAIGRALMSDPELILVDEPFEGLMPTLIPKIAAVFEELRAEGVTMIIADQKARETLDLADRVYVIEKGRIVFDDTPAALLDDEELKDQLLGVRQ